MKTIIAEMVDRKIPKENIIYIDLRKRSFRNVKTQEALENKIDEMSKSKGLKYLFYNCIYSFGIFPVIFTQKSTKQLNFYTYYPHYTYYFKIQRPIGDQMVVIRDRNTCILSGKKQPDHLVVHDAYDYTYDFYTTSLSSARSLLKQKRIIDMS